MIEFYEDQRVWCVIFGEGVVTEITCDRYPVKVKFENGEVEFYTSGGHIFSNSTNQSLFHHPVKIVQDEITAKPSINWKHVSSEFNYLAEDADGGVFLYEDKPYTATETWMEPPAIIAFWCEYLIEPGGHETLPPETVTRP